MKCFYTGQRVVDEFRLMVLLLVLVGKLFRVVLFLFWLVKSNAVYS